jgi:hypothetical protein
VEVEQERHGSLLAGGSSSRREWIVRLLQSTAAAAVAPAAANAWQHEHHAAQASKNVSASDWKPEFFSADENEQIIAIGERIVPGSKTALCNQVIDLVMTVEMPDHRSEFRNALSAFNKAAQSKYSSSFVKLSSDKQDKLLEAGCESSNGLHPHFEVLKEWFADTYWSSQEGMLELGWNKQIAWSSFPACPHPGT